MLFVLFFIAAVLVVPIMIDASKHGENHILRRVGADIANLEVSRKLLGIVHISVASIRGGVATVIGIASAFIIVFAAWQILRFLQFLYELVAR
jgi:hypothetical protein